MAHFRGRYLKVTLRFALRFLKVQSQPTGPVPMTGYTSNGVCPHIGLDVGRGLSPRLAGVCPLWNER